MDYKAQVTSLSSLVPTRVARRKKHSKALPFHPRRVNESPADRMPAGPGDSLLTTLWVMRDEGRAGSR